MPFNYQNTLLTTQRYTAKRPKKPEQFIMFYSVQRGIIHYNLVLKSVINFEHYKPFKKKFCERIAPISEKIRSIRKQKVVCLTVCVELNKHSFQQWVSMKANVEAISLYEVFQDCEVHSQICCSLSYTINAVWGTPFIEASSVLRCFVCPDFLRFCCSKF